MTQTDNKRPVLLLKALIPAVAAHIAVLFFPWDQPAGENPSAPVEIAVTLSPALERPEPAPAVKSETEQQPPEPAPLLRRNEQPPQSGPQQQIQTHKPMPSLSSHQIRQQLRAVVAESQQQQAQATTTLGQLRPLELPANWTRELLKLENNRFQSAWLNPTTVILDRWKNPDGSHEVRLKAPDGNIYCGRAAAFDPLEPLVEPVMLFRSC